ncbi:MAG: hypothetical protein GY739_02770, partial [Mesoflavibacter sp.]|nr:hypothetical protein [Mesoflavibacter sp.]
MATTERQTIDKLTAGSWSTWKFQMVVYLDGNNLLGIVDGREQRPDDGAPAAVTVDWDKREKKAKMMLVLAIDKSLLYLVISCTTSAEIWVALRQHFEKANAASVYYLLDQLFSFRLKEGDDVEAHLKAYTELLHKLEAVQLQLPDQIKVHALLRSFPASYQMLRTSLQMKGDDLSLEEVAQAVAAEDQQRKTAGYDYKSTTEAAFVVRGRWRGGGGRGRGGDVRGGYYNRQSDQSGQSKINGRCYNCNGWGHMARDCTSKSDQEKTAAVQEEYYAADLDAEHLLSAELLDESQKKTRSSDDQDESKASYADAVKSRRRPMDKTTSAAPWVIDSGATEHMASGETKIYDYV